MIRTPWRQRRIGDRCRRAVPGRGSASISAARHVSLRYISQRHVGHDRAPVRFLGDGLIGKQAPHIGGELGSTGDRYCCW